MKEKQLATKLLFGAVCLVLVWIVLFKMSFNLGNVALFIGERRFNLIPFYYDDEVGRIHLREVLLNVLIFAPFGLYLRMLGANVKKSILIGAAFSLTLELCQLILAIGSFDITDLITNTIGTALGIGAYALILLIFRKRERACVFINSLCAAVLSAFLALALLLFIANN